MEIKQIKELMAMMKKLGTKRLHLKKGSFEIEIEQAQDTFYPAPLEEIEFEEQRAPFKNNLRANAPLPKGADMAAKLSDGSKKEASGSYVTSPMVGTFYAAPSPEDPPFVKVGDVIEKGTIICIIEAMKVMNEIKAQVSGTIVEVLVDSGHPVEFGTKLFRIQ